ncbi:MAG: hypothetical protein HYT36_03810 [Candidatus Staskawiczbacteria bacterium]|nr:hypothetical protein [Candidatus Staskawiczbacteria bacterium]
MLSRATKKLAEEVFGYFDERDKRVFGHITAKRREEAKKNPEVCLIALLLAIKEKLPYSCAILRSTVEEALYEDNIEEAKKRLKKAK